MKIRIVCLCLAGMALHLLAHAQQPPNDTDLKAAYCIGVTQNNLAGMSGLPESSVKIEQDRLQHLQAYLLPRIQYVDPLGLGAARARGQADSKAVGEPDMVACASKCFAQPFNGSASDAQATAKQCVAACDTEHRLPRMWACTDLSWLPF